MNRIFEFTNKEEIYRKCLYASIAHAVMVGKYDLLSDEIAWDGDNYLFQNMGGVRGVIAFSGDLLVCGIQNEAEDPLDLEECIDKSNADVVKLAKNEVFPYLLLEGDDGKQNTVLTAIFWGRIDGLESTMTEEYFMKKSDNVFLPYLYEFDDLKRYWRDYYELSDEQEDMINSIFSKRVSSSSFELDESVKKKLNEWFGEKTDNCKSSFRELNIRM